MQQRAPAAALQSVFLTLVVFNVHLEPLDPACCGQYSLDMQHGWLQPMRHNPLCVEVMNSTKLGRHVTSRAKMNASKMPSLLGSRWIQQVQAAHQHCGSVSTLRRSQNVLDHSAIANRMVHPTTQADGKGRVAADSHVPV